MIGFNRRLATLVVVVGLTAGLGSAALGVTIPGYGGAGRGCGHNRIAKAVVNPPHGATLVLRHPGPQTRVQVGGRTPYNVRASRREVAVISDTPRQLRFHARCERAS